MSQHGGCSHGPELSWLEWQRGQRGAGADGPSGAGTAPCAFLLHARLKAEAPSWLCRGLWAVLGSGGAGGHGRSWCLTWGFVLSITQPGHAGAAVAPLLCALGARWRPTCLMYVALHFSETWLCLQAELPPQLRAVPGDVPVTAQVPANPSCATRSPRGRRLSPRGSSQGVVLNPGAHN